MGRVKTTFVGLSKYLWPSCYGFIIIPYSCSDDPAPRCCSPPSDLPPSLVRSVRARWAVFPCQASLDIISQEEQRLCLLTLSERILKESGQDDLCAACESLRFEKVLQKAWLGQEKPREILVCLIYFFRKWTIEKLKILTPFYLIGVRFWQDVFSVMCFGTSPIHY